MVAIINTPSLPGQGAQAPQFTKISVIAKRRIAEDPPRGRKQQCVLECRWWIRYNIGPGRARPHRHESPDPSTGNNPRNRDGKAHPITTNGSNRTGNQRAGPPRHLWGGEHVTARKRGSIPPAKSPRRRQTTCVRPATGVLACSGLSGR